MDEMASQITSLTIVYSAVYSDADQRKHQSSASLAFVRGIHRWKKLGSETSVMHNENYDTLQRCDMSVVVASQIIGIGFIKLV